MLVNELLTEAPVKPGQTVQINLQLDNYQQKLADLKNDKKFGRLTPKQLALYPKMVKQYEQIIKKLKKTKDSGAAGQTRLERLLATIEQKCSHAVATYKDVGMFLYRGVSQNSEAIYGKPFEERNPKDSRQEYTDAFDAALAAKGIEARRTNSIFVGTDEMAETYGNVYIIFPVNGFKFTYSTHEEDLILQGDHVPRMISLEKAVQLHKTLYMNKEAYSLFTNNVYPYKNDDSEVLTRYGFLGAAYFEKQWAQIKSLSRKGMLGEIGQEIAVKGFKALVDYDKIVKEFRINTDTFRNAIISTNEVMILGSYYGIKAEYESQIRKMLGMEERYYL